MREQLGIYSDLEIQSAKGLVRDLVKVVRGFRLYQCNHPVLREMLVQLRQRWEEATAGGALSLRFDHEAAYLDQESVYRAGGRNDVMPSRLHDHGIVGLVFTPGVEAEETLRLVRILAQDPGPHLDYGTMLWEGEFEHLHVMLDPSEVDGHEVTRTDFEAEVARLSDAGDPPVAPQYEQERKELRARPPQPPREEPLGTDRFEFTSAEKRRIALLVSEDDYAHTVRHTGRVVCAMAREDLTAEEAEPLERSMIALVESICHSGDLEGALEFLTRAHTMRASAHDLELALGELTYATFLENGNLSALFRGFDTRERLETHALASLFAQLGTIAAPAAARWLVETSHAEVVGPALRLFGDDATRILVPAYQQGGQTERDRIGAALRAIGTPLALGALAREFGRLPERSRLQLLQVIGRTSEPSLRAAIVNQLCDASERVRRAAGGALRRVDAPQVAKLLEPMLAQGSFDARSKEEVGEFFEMLSRIGNRAIAEVLADHCTVTGLRRAFLKLSPIQLLCLRALRRMRDRAAREVAEALKARVPRAMAEILDDPLADL